MTQWDYYMSGFWPGYYGPHKGKGAVAHWGNPYLGKGPKGQGSGKSKGKGKGDSPEAKGGEPEPAQVLSQNKGLQNTVEQLREANKKLKQAAAELKVGPAVPQPKAKAAGSPPVKTPPATLDTKGPWACRTCGLDHHNGNLKSCRTCGAEREEFSVQGPAPATVTSRYWGPVHDKASQKVLRRLPVASTLLLTTTTPAPSGGDEVMEPSQEEQERLRSNAAATVAFLESQTPVDETLLKGAKEKLATLTAQAKNEKALEKPDQDRGLVLVILDKQRLFNAQELVKDQALLEASAEKMISAQEAHSALGSQLEAAAAQRDKILGDLTAALKSVEEQCFFECQEKETAAQAAALTQVPGPAQTASRAEAASLLEYLQKVDTSGVGPPAACATLLARLQLLAGAQLAVVLDGDDMPGTPVSPLRLPPSPTPNATEEVVPVSSAVAAAEARELLNSTKGANKGVPPHPSGKGTGAGNGHAPY